MVQLCASRKAIAFGANSEARLTNHLPERYRHNVRYFGLSAPRLRRIAQTVIETNIPDSVAPEAANQATQRLWPPKDSRGNAMRRIRSVSPQEFERRQKPGRNR
jgi:predicted tellurium resistance membrane protein TerC